MRDATAFAEELRRGVLVQVRCAGGKSAADVVWQDFGDVVMVCGLKQFERLTSGQHAPMPIGFKREDVELTALPSIVSA